MIKPSTKAQNNFDFILRYIYENPGSTSIEARQALCTRNNENYSHYKYLYFFSVNKTSSSFETSMTISKNFGRPFFTIPRNDGLRGYCVTSFGMSLL